MPVAVVNRLGASRSLPAEAGSHEKSAFRLKSEATEKHLPAEAGSHGKAPEAAQQTPDATHKNKRPALPPAVRPLLGGRSLATTPGGVCHACTSRPRPYGCALQSIELRNAAAGCRAGRGRLKPMFGAAYERRCLQISMPPAVDRARRHGPSTRLRRAQGKRTGHRL